MKSLKGERKSIIYPLVSKELEYGSFIVYSNGYTIQSGRTDCQNVTSKVINLFLPFKNTEYSVTTTMTENSNDTEAFAAYDGALSGSVPDYDRGQKVDCFRISLRSSSTYRLNWTAIGFVDLEDPTVKKFIEEHQ